MTIHENITISFAIPKEYNKAMEFKESLKEQHIEYIESATTKYISFCVYKMYSNE